MPNGVGIRVRDDESFEKALRRFRSLVKKLEILREITRRQSFEKPSAKRHRTYRKRDRRHKHSKQTNQKK